MRIINSRDFKAWGVKPEVEIPNVPHYKLQLGEAFRGLQHTPLERNIIEHHTGFFDKQVDIGVFELL